MGIFGICIICIIIFPVSVFMQAKKNENNSIVEFLSREDSTVVKGIAICFVILAHLVSALEQQYTIKVLQLYSVLGGMGVLLFFFLSGYGLFKGYSAKEPNSTFIKKRIKNVVYPYALMKTIFYIIFVLFGQPFTINNFLGNYLDWFVVVIIIEYAIFYFTWTFATGNRKKQLILLNFIFSFFLAIIFWEMGLEPRWYNGLLLFPTGMLIAKYETKLLKYIKNNWIFSISISIVAFLGLGVLFSIYKGEATVWADFLKSLAGIALAFVVGIFFLKFKLKSSLMRFIGKRSLYFYIVHLNIMHILMEILNVSVVLSFYVVLFFTFIVAEIFWSIVQKTEKNMFN